MGCDQTDDDGQSNDTERDRVADALAELECGDHVQLRLDDSQEPLSAFVRNIRIEQDGLAGVAERTVQLKTFSGQKINASLEVTAEPDTNIKLSHAVVDCGSNPVEADVVTIEAVKKSPQQTLGEEILSGGSG